MTDSAFELALKKLAGRAYSREKIKSVLSKAGFGDEEIKAALEKLEDMGYLRDKELAKNLASRYLDRKPSGRAFIAAKLRQEGIAPALIADVLASVSVEQEFDLARQTAVKYIMRKRNNLSRRSLAQHLERRGFPAEIIGQVLRLYCADENIYLD